MPVVSATCYELLGVPVHASRSELTAAWIERRTRITKQPASFSPEQVEALCARLDEAFAILSDPKRNKRYRTYMAQQYDSSSPLHPDDFLHPVVAEWSRKSTQIPAPPSRAPETSKPELAMDDLGLPRIDEPPAPWESNRPSAKPMEALMEEAVQALADAVSDQPAFTEHFADEGPDLYNEWGGGDADLAKTIPMGPAAPAPEKSDPSSMTRLTGRRLLRAMPHHRTHPASRLPQPWDKAED